MWICDQLALKKKTSYKAQYQEEDGMEKEVGGQHSGVRWTEMSFARSQKAAHDRDRCRRLSGSHQRRLNNFSRGYRTD